MLHILLNAFKNIQSVNGSPGFPRLLKAQKGLRSPDSPGSLGQIGSKQCHLISRSDLEKD